MRAGVEDPKGLGSKSKAPPLRSQGSRVSPDAGKVQFDRARDKYIDAANYERKPRKSSKETDGDLSEDEPDKDAEDEPDRIDAPVEDSDEDESVVKFLKGRPGLALQAQLLLQARQKLKKRGSWPVKGQRSLSGQDKLVGLLQSPLQLD